MSSDDTDVAELSHLRRAGDAYGIDVLDSVPRSALDPGLVANLSVEWARMNCILPVMLDGKVCVLTGDPDQVSQQEYLALLLGKELRPVLALRQEILACIEQCYYNKDASPEAFMRDLDEPEPMAMSTEPSSADLLKETADTPVTQLVNLIMLEAVKQRASDIHFEPFESRLRVRYRIDGVLYEQASPPKHLEQSLVSRLKVMARMDIAEKRLPQDGMMRVRVGEREIDIRMSTIPIAEGERVVLRLLDSGSALMPLDALGMSEKTLNVLERIFASPSGMITVCGPTGSGKTTTLYAALGCLDSARCNILTIEDPIEYTLPDIGQIHVKPKIGMTFSTGLRHILRQDPDVILIGETRDHETAGIALRAALTGHLVFTTLHTNDAAGAILRLLDMGVSSHMLSSCLRASLGQRLVRCLCQSCKRATLLKADILLPESPQNFYANSKVWEAAGCTMCLEGFKGRTGIFELLLIDEEIQRLIRSEDSSQLRLAATQRGMVTLAEDGLRKVMSGVTTFEEVTTAVSADIV